MIINKLIFEKDFEYQKYDDNNIYSYCYDKIENCNKCSFHSEEDINDINKLICDECKGNRYYSLTDKICKECLIKNNGCLICSDETNEENIKCDKCQEGYYLTSDGICFKCSDFFGEGCSACDISPYDLKLYCSKCSSGFFLDYEGNFKQCLNDANLEGCEECGVSAIIIINVKNVKKIICYLKINVLKKMWKNFLIVNILKIFVQMIIKFFLV